MCVCVLCLHIYSVHVYYGGPAFVCGCCCQENVLCVCVSSTCREGEVRELERQVQEMRETVTQLQLERTELHTKVYIYVSYIYMF